MVPTPFSWNFPPFKPGTLTRSYDDLMLQTRCIACETDEIWAELIRYRQASEVADMKACITRSVAEAMDVIHACETYIRASGIAQEQLDAMKHEVVRKNEERGYYEVVS